MVTDIYGCKVHVKVVDAELRNRGDLGNGGWEGRDYYTTFDMVITRYGGKPLKKKIELLVDRYYSSNSVEMAEDLLTYLRNEVIEYKLNELNL